jgi:LemA protein
MQWVVLAFVAVAVVVTVSLYNRLVGSRNSVKNLWQQIDVQLKRRYDLIPNLVQAVRDVMNFEQETLEKVINARSRALGASEPGARMRADAEVSQALMGLFAVVEQYPEIQSNQNVRQLQAELTTTENAIASVRTGYNNAVRDYTNLLETVPSNVVAGLFQFQRMPYWEAREEDRQVPKVSLR